VNRLTVPSAVCAAALAFLLGCSSEQPTEAGPAASAASAVPSSAPVGGPAASAPVTGQRNDAALCEKVAAAKTALNEELKRVASADGTVPPIEGKKAMTSLSATLSDLAASGDGELAEALDALAGEASKAAGADNPMRAALSTSFDAAGQKVDNVCAKA
jgi:hypothetical protein